jgi:signal transduction histidine kinase
MNKTESYRELEKSFLSTFLGELLPGVLHNFANPLNGIMGRAKLLQRRLADTVQKLDDIHPGFAKEFGEDKVTRDVNSIASEAERFFEIFRDLATKVSTLSSAEPERINLSRLIEAEVRFADFYLDFKHDIKKNLHLDANLPGIVGNAADYSLCLSAFINSARERLRKCPERELSISSSHDAGHIQLILKDNGAAISQACARIAAEDHPTQDGDGICEADRILCWAILLLKQCNAVVAVEAAEGCNQVSVTIPCG